MALNKNTPPIALWNPMWIVIWAFLFSPIFGAILQRGNWRDMGQIEKAESCGKWVTIGIVLFIGYLLAEPFLPDSAFADFYFIALWIVFYAVWAFLDGPGQIRYIKSRYGDSYHHKLWGKPLMFGAGCFLLWFALSLTYIILLISTGVLVIQ